MQKQMDQIVALCKRRGFIFQSSEIYGGLQGFWDYGPLGTEFKRNVRDAWYHDMVTRHDEFATPAGAPRSFSMFGIETSIIMHPQVWKCSGHYDLFVDKMVDCKESKRRHRFDHLQGSWAEYRGQRLFFSTDQSGDEGVEHVLEKALKFFGVRRSNAADIAFEGGEAGRPPAALRPIVEAGSTEQVVAPEATQPGTLTPPRDYNLMFKTIVGALGGEEDAAFLRPETAQGMFVNFKNVLDSGRVKVPFGIAQIGKSFRNEITPRNFTFRSREFEQMEMEFFCHPSESREWYQYWRDRRYQWYINLGISKENLILRDHAADELSHYSVGTADVEYAFPFLEAGSYGELEGIAHRGDFDLRSHQEGKLVRKGNELVVETDADGNPKHRGSGKDLVYFDDQTRERFVPHVIEPAAGADRTALAFLCEAYSEDEQPDEKGEMQKRVLLRLHPRLAPVKAAIFPLIKKDGMPEKALEIYRELKSAGIASYYDQQGAIGRRYRRQDEIGTPYCITVDGETATHDSVTIRDRDSLTQERIGVKEIVSFVQERLRR